MRDKLVLCLRVFLLTSVCTVVAGCIAPKAETFGGHPVDPLEPIRIIRQFFRDNPPRQVGARIWWRDWDVEEKVHFAMLGSEEEYTSGVELAVVKAVRTDSRPLTCKVVPGSGTDTGCANVSLILTGPRYCLLITLDNCGFMVGHNHRLVNPSLAAILRKVFEREGIMKGEVGEGFDEDLKRASGELGPWD